MSLRISISFSSILCAVVLHFAFCVPYAFAQSPQVRLSNEDHIAIIGNTLADRMQHSGWLDTYLHAAYPDLDLTIRNLGYPGDELTLRLREENFGNADQWLTRVEADVILCFFGYNEALRGPAGLETFRSNLATTIDGMLAQKYNGEKAPQLVFFSPIAHEDLKNPNLPDGSANNANLLIYSKAMKDVCVAKKIPFVDLFAATQRLYSNNAAPLTINGIHLTEDGDRMVAGEIVKTLFPNAKPSSDPKRIERIRAAVSEKNYHWFSRYRVVDGYNVFGGRSSLAWFGQSNADVMMREMEILDVMTANRDRAVWAAAQGKEYKVVDDNLPPELEVKTNIPGKQADGSHLYLGGEEAITKMKIAKGMQVNLFASEERFPELVNPVQMAVDTDGKLFVSVWPSYPHWNPTEPRRDKIICLPDDNGDGIADRCVTFADELNSVTGFEFWGGGMLVAALPEIWFLKDTDGDDKADVKIRMLQGLSSADSHHSANAMLIGSDGWLYWSRGIFNVAAMETPTKTYRSEQSGVHRFNPRTFEMEFHFPIGPNPHGDVVDQWGYQFANDGTGGVGSYVNIGKGIGNKPWFKMRVRPVAATGILSSSHFPEANQGNFLVCNCIGFLGVLQHEVSYNGAEITATEIEPILVSSDPNFRPSDVEVGGDGALYVADWSNAIIGHMQHNMRDPNRDHEHGRIYRVTAKDRPLLKSPKLNGQPIANALQALLGKENSTRYRARLELSGRATDEVVSAISKWTATLDVENAEQAQALLESLWVLEEHRRPDIALLKKVYRAKEGRVRAAAIRTLGHWASKVTGWEDILLEASRDSSALARAEAVKSAVEFGGAVASEVIFEVAIRPIDPELETVLKYAKSKINVDSQLESALASGKKLSDAAVSYALINSSPDSLLKLPASVKVYEAILGRVDASVETLRTALASLAKLQNASSVPLLISLVQERDQKSQIEALRSLQVLINEQPPADLKANRIAFQNLAQKGKQANTRQLGYVAWIMSEGVVDSAFAAASASKDALRDLLTAIPAIKDVQMRSKTFASVRSLMFELPPALQAEPQGSRMPKSGIHVDYFYPTPSDVAIETLAQRKPNESGLVPEITINVPQRKEPDAFALRFTGAISIPTTGKYSFSIASDDGSRLYLDNQLLINNDGLHGMVEKQADIELTAGAHSIVVTYFDNGGGDGLEVRWSGPGFAKQKIAPDRLSVDSSEESIHDLAIRIAAEIPGFEKEKFADWTRLIKADLHRNASISALKSLPESAWETKEIPSLIDNLVGFLTSIPAKDRTSGIASETIALVKAFSRKLPADKIEKIEQQLLSLDVRAIALGTVIERMIYDKEKIVVQAGKPVEIRFTNTDNMPHNFVVVQPGALEEVGLLAEASAQDPDAKERHFVPKSDKILVSSKLIDPGQSQAIPFDVPATPGMYPYVCTYPGHWRRMFGVLIVVQNQDEYQAAPEAYLASHPLPIQDDLLKTIGRNTEWKMEDLVADLEELEHGRSYEVGKSLFKAANCIGCHKLAGEGQQLGPDLAKLDEKKMTASTLLKSILQPSAEIEAKYQSQMFLLNSGTVVSGMVVEETNESYKILVDPLAKGEPVVLEKSDIESNKKSTASIMPEGLLNKLTKAEILDLLAYLMARGDKDHDYYKDHHHH